MFLFLVLFFWVSINFFGGSFVLLEMVRDGWFGRAWDLVTMIRGVWCVFVFGIGSSFFEKKWDLGFRSGGVFRAVEFIDLSYYRRLESGVFRGIWVSVLGV